MNITEPTAVPAGTSVDITLSPLLFDKSKKTTSVTLTGRATGVVQVKIKSRRGDTFFAPAGEASIDLTSGDTLIIEGTAVAAVRIDDTANNGANLAASIEVY